MKKFSYSWSRHRLRFRKGLLLAQLEWNDLVDFFFGAMAQTSGQQIIWRDCHGSFPPAWGCITLQAAKQFFFRAIPLEFPSWWINNNKPIAMSCYVTHSVEVSQDLPLKSVTVLLSRPLAEPWQLAPVIFTNSRPKSTLSLGGDVACRLFDHSWRPKEGCYGDSIWFYGILKWFNLILWWFNGIWMGCTLWSFVT